MSNVTRYFKSSLEAQCSPVIDFTKSFEELTADEINKGQLRPEVISSFKRQQGFNRTEFEVCVVLKTIVTDFSGAVREGNQTEDLTGVFYVPAKVDSSGQMSMSGTKLPYIPREFLYPMIDEELCLGGAKKVDEYLRITTSDRIRIKSWKDYLSYAIKMFKFVTGVTEFNKRELSESIRFDGRYYIFLNTQVNASKSIIDLYDHINKTSPTVPLYDTLTSLRAAEKTPLTDTSDIASMLGHKASMNGKFPLSPSQREAVIHFNQLQNGEILAVNGPPGTGKTTLLQSIVAGMVVDHALAKAHAPVIAASSTNNQAVTNIIDSFGKIDKIRSDICLEERWLENVHSFAVYFPSSSKKPESYSQYQYINREYKFLADIDSAENREKSEKLFKEKFSSFFGKTSPSIASCQEYIYQSLLNTDTLRKTFLKTMSTISRITGGNLTQFTLNRLNNAAAKMQEAVKLEMLAESEKSRRSRMQERMKQWQDGYSSVGCLTKLFPAKMKQWFISFRNDEEADKIDFSSCAIDTIVNYYVKEIDDSDERIRKYNENIKSEKSAAEEYKKQADEVRRIFDGVIMQLKSSECARPFLTEKQLSALGSLDIMKINEIMDSTLRYVEFWLSVHYYEAEFLKLKPLTDKQLPLNIESVLEDKLRRIAMASPCLVMTFFMLPGTFKSYLLNEKKSSYLYNFADLLIADEAGQTSPEIAAAGFSLAKKAVIVGDDFQIPPVWSMTNALDVSLAQEYGIVSKDNPLRDFEILAELGLTTSQSSLMRAASYSCRYNKYDRGLFLSEHRRCFDEIIGYCNDLLYEGHLEPKRGSSNTGFPSMAYKDIPSDTAGKSGTSRINQKEAEEIADWIDRHAEELENRYSNDKMKIEDIIAVITPFKAQADLIGRRLRSHSNTKKVKAGTVHTFQGAERPIIIFSTVYGRNDSCGFIDNNKNLMNVAVSRAKDCFYVFGCIDCLKGKAESSASGLMYRYVKDNPIE